MAGLLLNAGILSWCSEGKKAFAGIRSVAVPPSLLASLRLGLRAAFREPWLVAVALLVALLRRAAVWPAWAVGWVVLGRAAVRAARSGPFDPLAVLEGVLTVASSPRFIALVAGLWLAGLAVGGALRIAYVSGALPTLGASMAGAEGPRFASGVAFGFPRVLAAAALGFLLELGGALFALTLAAAALRVTSSVAGSGASPLLAAAVALALTLAVMVPSVLSPVADAGVARAAVYGEGPGEAFAEAGARLLARPGTFVLAGLAFGALGLVAPALIAGLGSVSTGFASYARPLVLAGPELMIAAAAAAIAAAVDVVWLGTIAALACGNVTRG
jgi:hypothetical protein